MNNAGIWMAQKAEWEAEDPEGEGPLKGGPSFWPRMDPNKPPGTSTTFAFTNRFCYNKLVVQ